MLLSTYSTKNTGCTGRAASLAFSVPCSGEGGVVDMSQKRQGLVNNPANMEHGAGVPTLAGKGSSGSEEEIRGAQKDLQSQDIVNNPADMNICPGRDTALDEYAQKCASLGFRHLVPRR
jgi:hypothetical protein